MTPAAEALTVSAVYAVEIQRLTRAEAIAKLAPLFNLSPSYARVVLSSPAGRQLYRATRARFLGFAPADQKP